MQSNTAQFRTLECDTVQCDTVQCDTVQLRTLECDVVQCAEACVSRDNRGHARNTIWQINADRHFYSLTLWCSMKTILLVDLIAKLVCVA